ncbi:molybdopterin dehydrogenase FAD-binding protein, partial [mine drainage metagenome]
AYIKQKRRAGDFSIAAVAAFVSINESGNCETARLAVTSIGPINFRSKKAEEFLTGKKLSDQNIAKAAQLLVDSVEPVADPYGSVEFKKEILRLVGIEALSKATDRALGV